MIFKHHETCRCWFIRRKEFQFRPKYPCLITNKKYHPLQFCRYNSVPLLHQPSWSQKDDFGQKWVHQSDSPPEERCGSRYEHGQQRALLVRHLPKEDLQVSVNEIRMNLAFLFLILRIGCKLFFFNPELKWTWLKTPVITSQSLVVTLMLLKASLLTGSTATCTGLTAFAAPSQWLLLTEAVGKLFSTETCQNPVLLWSTPAASKSNSMTREDNRMATIFLWACAQGENKLSGKV